MGCVCSRSHSLIAWTCIWMSEGKSVQWVFIAAALENSMGQRKKNWISLARQLKKKKRFCSAELANVVETKHMSRVTGKQKLSISNIPQWKRVNSKLMWKWKGWGPHLQKFLFKKCYYLGSPWSDDWFSKVRLEEVAGALIRLFFFFFSAHIHQ